MEQLGPDRFRTGIGPQLGRRGSIDRKLADIISRRKHPVGLEIDDKELILELGDQINLASNEHLPVAMNTRHEEWELMLDPKRAS